MFHHRPKLRFYRCSSIRITSKIVRGKKSGHYWCLFRLTAKNQCFSTTKYFNVFIYVLPLLFPVQYPSFRSEPTSVVQSPGSAVRLWCSASPSSASVSWHFQGLPLDRDTLPGVELTQDSIRISNLTSRHAGVYQCVARFSHGAAVASRLARVALAGEENHASLHTSKRVEIKK